MVQVKTLEIWVRAEALDWVNLVKGEDQCLQIYKSVEGLDLTDTVIEQVQVADSRKVGLPRDICDQVLCNLVELTA